MMFMNKAFRGESFNLATRGSICVFLNAENGFFPMRRKKEGGKGKKKKEILIKTVTEIATKVKTYKHQELNKTENLYHSFSTVVNYIQSQF